MILTAWPSLSHSVHISYWVRSGLRFLGDSWLSDSTMHLEHRGRWSVWPRAPSCSHTCGWGRWRLWPRGWAGWCWLAPPGSGVDSGFHCEPQEGFGERDMAEPGAHIILDPQTSFPLLVLLQARARAPKHTLRFAEEWKALKHRIKIKNTFSSSTETSHFPAVEERKRQRGVGCVGRRGGCAETEKQHSGGLLEGWPSLGAGMCICWVGRGRGTPPPPSTRSL